MVAQAQIPAASQKSITVPVPEGVKLPIFMQNYGNAASRNHSFGWAAEAAVDHARAQVAALLGGDAKEIVWTSGATEANNLAIKGAASYLRKQGNHIITVETEHKSVLDT